MASGGGRRATGGGQFGRFDRGYDYDDFGNLRGNDHCGGHGASNDSTENLLQLIQPERQAQHEILAKIGKMGNHATTSTIGLCGITRMGATTGQLD
jgi:hypothetical protein